MRRSKAVLVAVAVVGAVSVLAPPTASAIPSFAKKFGYSCSSCHNAWPMLNAFGRRFKENGYQVERGQELAEQDHVKAEELSLYKYTPLTARIKGYAFDRKKGKETKIRPLHEVEVMLAGNVGERGSYWLEMEGEDEADWDIAIESGFVGVHPDDRFNGVLGYGPVFWVDPYQTLADGGRRFTRSHKAFADLGFATGQRLRSGTPQLAAYGRFGGRVFYAAGVTTGTGDPEGEDDKDFMGRVAVDANDNIMIGGYLWKGRKLMDEEIGADFARGGIDFQIQYDTFSIFGNWMRASDDLVDEGISEDNDLFSFTALYVVRRGKRPLVMPLVRIDNYELASGAESFTDASFNLTVFALANWNVSFELYQQLDTPPGVAKDRRATLLFNAVF